MSSPTTYPLRQMRLAAGLTIRGLETRTGINRGRLSILERGVVPTAEEARKILTALTEAVTEEATNGTQGSPGPDDTAA
jgi:transcriptional regulator with XRE-family HTH domain